MNISTIDKFIFQEFYESKLSTIDTDVCRFFTRIDAKMAHKFKHTFNSDRYWAWDQLIMAVAINNQVALETKHVYATVELHGGLTRGQVVVDWLNKLQKDRNVFLLTKIDNGVYRQLLLSSMHGKPIGNK